MAEHSTIEWTDATWNIVTGCTVVSPGCQHCYAMKLAGGRLANIPSRRGLTVDTKAGPIWTGEVRFNAQWLDQPLRWKRPRRIFVAAHGDLFHEGVPDEVLDKVFAVMALAPQHSFQVLTKRAERMRAYIKGHQSKIPYLGRMPLERIHLEAAGHMEGDGGFMDTLKHHGNVYSLYLDAPWPLPNVWLGVSAEDQQRADERIPHLLAAPAAVRFLSAEPLLGQLDVGQWLVRRLDHCPEVRELGEAEACQGCPMGGPDCPATWEPRLDWVIAGGESGTGARPMHPGWARSLRDQCQAAGVPFFFKQWGSWVAGEVYSEGDSLGHTRHQNDQEHRGRPSEWWSGDVRAGVISTMVGKKAAGRLLDGRTWDQMPEARRG